MNKENLANAFINGSLSDTATSVDLKAGYVTYQPTTPYFATITPFGELSTKANSEIVKVTNISSDTLTIVRGQRGTTAKNFSDGAIFSNGIYVEDLDDLAMTILKSAYPVGSSYWNGSDSRNPSVIFGFGTWSALEGVALGGRSTTSGSPFNVTAGTIIGADRHTLTIAEMPSHNHSMGDITLRANAGALDSNATNLDDFPGSNGPIRATNVQVGNAWNGNMGFTGGGGSHNNIQRTKVGYLWQRTA